MAAAGRRSKSCSAHTWGNATYWRESARPLTSLVFVAPLLIGYELGVLLLGNQAARNGADVWLRRSLGWLGFGQYFLLPLLTCGLLLAWHHMRRESWKLEWNVLSGMLFESALLGAGLLVLAQCQAEIWHHQLGRWKCATTAAHAPVFARMVAYCGAGIYEELLFRLALLPVCAWLLKLLISDARKATAGSVILTSLLFAAAHYRLDFIVAGWHVYLPAGDAFEWSTFIFRFAAGACFGTLFVRRGFGITAGAHALYDILAAIL